MSDEFLMKKINECKKNLKMFANLLHSKDRKAINKWKKENHPLINNKIQDDGTVLFVLVEAFDLMRSMLDKDCNEITISDYMVNYTIGEWKFINSKKRLQFIKDFI